MFLAPIIFFTTQLIYQLLVFVVVKSTESSDLLYDAAVVARVEFRLAATAAYYVFVLEFVVETIK